MRQDVDASEAAEGKGSLTRVTYRRSGIACLAVDEHQNLSYFYLHWESSNSDDGCSRKAHHHPRRYKP